MSLFPQLFFAAAVALSGLVSGPAVAHGEFGEELEAFHKHVDDYRAEVEGLVDAAESIARAQAEGKAVKESLEGFIDQWENVAVHGAIETRATVTYPGIWQAIIALQQAAESGASADRFQALTEDLKAALWQGFGALRLAASQVESGQAPANVEPVHGDSGPAEVVDAIVAQLEEAVSAYESGDTARAKDLIAKAYIQRFEGLEGDLIEQNPELVRSLEKDFNATLPLAMENGKPVSAVETELERMVEDLETAKALLVEAEASRSEVF